MDTHTLTHSHKNTQYWPLLCWAADPFVWVQTLIQLLQTVFALSQVLRWMWWADGNHICCSHMRENVEIKANIAKSISMLLSLLFSSSCWEKRDRERASWIWQQNRQPSSGTVVEWSRSSRLWPFSMREVYAWNTHVEEIRIPQGPIWK